MNAFNALVRGVVSLGMLMAIAGTAIAQQDYPNKPIRIIVAYPPGGSTNVLARLLGQKLSESWGQQVIVDNRPGGNTVIGTEALAKSAPDGYSIMLVTSIHALNGILIPKKLPYDTVKDFAPIATVTRSEYLLVLHPSVPANSLQELIALAKSAPGKLNYATSGSGTAVHLGVEMFSAMVGIKMEHIPYKGAGQLVTDLIGGQVQLSFIAPVNVLSHVRAGKLKAIAIAGDARAPALPQVPTFAEAGVAGFELKNWYGIVAPAAMPRAIIDKLSAEFAKTLAMPDIRQKLIDQGMSPMFSGPDKFAALISAEMTKYGEVIKSAKIKIED